MAILIKHIHQKIHIQARLSTCALGNIVTYNLQFIKISHLLNMYLLSKRLIFTHIIATYRENFYRIQT